MQRLSGTHHSGAGLPRKLAGSTLHLVDGIRRRTVDHGDIWLEGLAEDILVELLGTLNATHRVRVDDSVALAAHETGSRQTAAVWCTTWVWGRNRKQRKASLIGW